MERFHSALHRDLLDLGSFLTLVDGIDQFVIRYHQFVNSHSTFVARTIASRAAFGIVLENRSAPADSRL